MKNPTNNSENNNGTTLAPPLQKEQDTEATLEKIRQVLKDNHEDKNDQSEYPPSISDKITEKIRIFEMVIRGVNDSAYNGISLSGEDAHGVLLAWLEVKKLLEIRDEEHLKIYSLAKHGREEI